MANRNYSNYKIPTRKKHSRPRNSLLQLVCWEFSESYILYHVTAVPHAEPEKNVDKQLFCNICFKTCVTDFCQCRLMSSYKDNVNKRKTKSLLVIFPNISAVCT